MTSYSTWEPRSWIVPPGLLETLMRFEIRCDAILDKKKAGKHSCLLIRGETGVGKSMFAEFFIHKYLKQFPEKKVFFLNCSAIPATLLESELFGYKKGSATGAFKDKKGIFDLAGDGVIVLEELGELNNHQLKLVGLNQRTESPATNRQASQPVAQHRNYHWDRVRNDVQDTPGSSL